MPERDVRRHLPARATLAFLALPGVVAFLVPTWLVYTEWDRHDVNKAALMPWLSGVGLLLWCVHAFYSTGRGTLAPWDPPRHLVASGPYRWSRNPMYLAVALILIGWAIAFSSEALWLYAALVGVAFHIRVTVSEEPFLARTHGDSWTRYKARVRRWL